MPAQQDGVVTISKAKREAVLNRTVDLADLDDLEVLYLEIVARLNNPVLHSNVSGLIKLMTQNNSVAQAIEKIRNGTLQFGIDS